MHACTSVMVPEPSVKFHHHLSRKEHSLDHHQVVLPFHLKSD